MKLAHKFIVFLIVLLCFLNRLISQPLTSIDNLVSITFYERTGSTFDFTFDIESEQLQSRLDDLLNSSNNDFQGWNGVEFYDVYISNSEGDLDLQGEFITIEARYENVSSGGGLNIIEIQFNFENDISIYASNLESYFATGDNYANSSELKAVDCDLETWSTLGNNSQSENRLRLTVGIQNNYSEFFYDGCLNDGFVLELNGNIYNEDNRHGLEIFEAQGGCDSLVNVSLNFDETMALDEIYYGCKGDNYSLNINGTVYDEFNPIGIETFISDNSCDTILNIMLNYNNIDTTYINYDGYIDDGFSVIVNGKGFNEQIPEGLELMKNSNGCDSIIIINLVFKERNDTNDLCGVFLPNVFSPNDDGVNDIFKVYYDSECIFSNVLIRIFDRWGELVYSSNNIDFEWNGKLNDEKAEIDSFTYVLEFNEVNDVRKIIKGSVLLVR